MKSALMLKLPFTLFSAKLIFVLGCSLLIISSCKHDGIPADQLPPIPFSKVQLIYGSYCGKCHDGKTNELKYNFYNPDEIIGSVVPYNSSKSKSYQSMISTLQIMPPPPDAMPTSDRTLIRIWIDQGAKNP